MGAGNEVDRDRVVLAGNMERRRLAGQPDELREMRACDLADVEPGEDGVRESDDADPEPVAPRLRVVLDEPCRRERAELARDRARREPKATGQLVRPELTAGCKLVEHRAPPAGRLRSGVSMVDVVLARALD